MKTFAVTYAYDAQTSLRDEVRPRHRAFLSGLYAAGVLLASGPVTSGASQGALIIVKAEDEASALALLDNDPFVIEGTVAERQAVEWTPVFGPWTP
ncbi:hypothetical protein SAMN06309944_0146 [Micrococcales bacterium KH10]|nr:hypothetical protein SAMN06309944_0146 [Micrococcales bacterium KH10]